MINENAVMSPQTGDDHRTPTEGICLEGTFHIFGKVLVRLYSPLHPKVDG